MGEILRGTSRNQNLKAFDQRRWGFDQRQKAVGGGTFYYYLTFVSLDAIAQFSTITLPTIRWCLRKESQENRKNKQTENVLRKEVVFLNYFGWKKSLLNTNCRVLLIFYVKKKIGMSSTTYGVPITKHYSYILHALIVPNLNTNLVYLQHTCVTYTDQTVNSTFWDSGGLEIL